MISIAGHFQQKQMNKYIPLLTMYIYNFYKASTTELLRCILRILSNLFKSYSKIKNKHWVSVSCGNPPNPSN